MLFFKTSIDQSFFPCHTIFSSCTNYKNSKLIIIIKNSICNSVLEENPKLKSTKQDAAHHGYGVKTIHSIAEKYNGTVDFFEEGLMFICRVELQREETIKT